MTYQNGPWLGFLLLIAGMSVLRWPVIHLTRRVRDSCSGMPDTASG